GGAILSLACDVRVMADASCFALNEVDLGVALPPRLLRAMGQHQRADAMRPRLLGGEGLRAARALAAGLVTKPARAVDVLPVSMTRARQLAEKPARAFAAHKAALDIVGPAASPDELDTAVAYVMDLWFGDEAKARRAALIE